MTNKNYIIDYICYSSGGIVLHDGKMRVKNRASDFEAKCSLEDFLKRKYENFGSLVIRSCVIDLGIPGFGDFFGFNPFNS
jgi:hypothetical protein